jgi:hypothetical protein
MDSHVGGAVLDPKSFAPIAKSKFSFANPYELNVITINGLLFRRSPSAITWFIVTKVVDSVDAMAVGRANSHVSKEVFKRVEPSLANRYSGVSRITAAAFSHCTPNRELFGSGFVVSCIVGCSIFRGMVSAGFSQAREYVSKLNAFLYPAVTSANNPSEVSGCISLRAVDFHQYGQPSKNSTNWSGIYNGFRHFVTSKLVTIGNPWRAVVKPLFGSYPIQVSGIIS